MEAVSGSSVGMYVGDRATSTVREYIGLGGSGDIEGETDVFGDRTRGVGLTLGFGGSFSYQSSTMTFSDVKCLWVSDIEAV